MSTSRYSGGVTLALKFIDAQDKYQVRVSAKGSGEKPSTIYVGIPPASTLAVDSPEAFDQAAHAALSFAPQQLSEYAENHPSGSGWMIRRGRPPSFKRPTAAQAKAINATFKDLADDWKRLAAGLPKRGK